jgi:hypothetical protein
MDNVVDMHRKYEQEPTVVSTGETYVDQYGIEYHVLNIAEEIVRPGEFTLIYRRKGHLFAVPVELFERAITDGDLSLVKE